MSELIVAAVFGLLGGLLRSIVGLAKHFRAKKKTKFKVKYFIITLILAGFIGMLLSAAFAANYLIYLVVGYAGIDLLENLVKITKRKE